MEKFKNIKINVLDILKIAINLLSNQDRTDSIIYYGNNIIKKNKDRLDIWIVLDDELIINNSMKSINPSPILSYS